MINQLTNPRQLRGLEILSKPETVRELKKNVWEVRSQSGNGYYQVSRKFVNNHSHRNSYDWSCTCPDHLTRNVICKHIYSVQFSLTLRGEVEKDATPKQIESVNEIIACPSCKGSEVVKSGNRKTTFGSVQRYECKTCGYRFTVDKGFSRMKHDPKVITLSMDLFFKGVSDRKIADHLKQFYDIEVAHTTPLRWIKRYISLLGKYAEKHQAEVGKVWHCDETTVFIKKEGEKKYYEWIWNLMDSKTRFLLACQVTEGRNVEDARIPLQKAKEATKVRPYAIVTDGLPSYNKAVKDEFFEWGADIPNPHIRLKDFETKPNNNILERLNGTFRERTKVFRSLDSSESAMDFCNGMRVYYNYIRPHQGINGLTPAQMANIPIDLMGNRWQKMIELAITK